MFPNRSRSLPFPARMAAAVAAGTLLFVVGGSASAGPVASGYRQIPPPSWNRIYSGNNLPPWQVAAAPDSGAADFLAATPVFPLIRSGFGAPVPTITRWLPPVLSPVPIIPWAGYGFYPLYQGMRRPLFLP